VWDVEKRLREELRKGQASKLVRVLTSYPTWKL